MHKHATVLTREERRVLLGLAREAIREFLISGATTAANEKTLTPGLREARACFVTLHRHGELRGCIGTLEGREPLFRAVQNNACGAAFRDTRFAPVDADELPDLEIEISVLTEPAAAAFASPEELLGRLRPGVDGVILKAGGRSATFLPQVWRQLQEPASFMDALAGKAMLPANAWREPGAEVLTYQVESFSETGRAA